MKKFWATVCIAVLIPLVVIALDANQMHYVEIYPAKNATGTTTNLATTGVNVSTYKGNAVVACSIGAGGMATVTNTVTMTHCATTNGTYTTVTNLAGNAVAFTHAGKAAASLQTARIELDRLHTYVRVKAANGADTNVVSAVLIAPMKSQ